MLKSKYIISQIIFSTLLAGGFILLSSGRWIDHAIAQTTITSSPDTLLGKVEVATGDVRRRNSGELGWTPLMKGDVVYKKDAVFTGRGAETKLTIENDVQIKLGPESLIKLNKVRGKNLIHVNQGEMALRSGHAQIIDIVRGNSGVSESMSVSQTEQKVSGQPNTGNKAPRENTSSNTAAEEISKTADIRDVAFKTIPAKRQNLAKTIYEDREEDSNLIFIVLYAMASGIAILGFYETKRS